MKVSQKEIISLKAIQNKTKILHHRRTTPIKHLDSVRRNKAIATAVALLENCFLHTAIFRFMSCSGFVTNKASVKQHGAASLSWQGKNNIFIVLKTVKALL